MSLLQNNSTIRYFFCKGWKYGGAGSSWKQDDEMIIRFCAQLTIRSILFIPFLGLEKMILVE